LATAYLLAYLLYLMVKETEHSSVFGLPATPYDTNRLIIKRRYI
jgi:hypothetical protein